MTIVEVVALLFIAVFLGVVTIYMWYVTVKTSPRYHLKKRMRTLAVDVSDRRFPQDLRLEILKEMNPIDRFLFAFRPVRKLDALMDNAGLKTADVKLFILLIFIFAVLFYTVGAVVGLGKVFPLLLASVGAMLPMGYLSVIKSIRFRRFTEQFPNALDMVARSLRAGHSLGAAIQLVGSETAEPIAGLFRSAYEEQALGLSMRESLEHMSRRMPGTDLKFFVMATNIHREIGGNLGEILTRLAHTIRDRLRIRRQVRVYTAQARLSGYVLAMVPASMAVIFYFALPGYMEELFKVDWGIYAVYIAITMQVLGFLVIRKIINIKI